MLRCIRSPTGDLSEEASGEMGGASRGMGRGDMSGLNAPSNQVTVTITQVGEIAAADGTVIASASYKLYE